MKRGLGASWLPRVGWEGFGNAKNGSMKRGLGVSHGSQGWGGKDGSFCCGRFHWSTKAIAAAPDPTPS